MDFTAIIRRIEDSYLPHLNEQKNIYKDNPGSDAVLYISAQIDVFSYFVEILKKNNSLPSNDQEKHIASFIETVLNHDWVNPSSHKGAHKALGAIKNLLDQKNKMESDTNKPLVPTQSIQVQTVAPTQTHQPQVVAPTQVHQSQVVAQVPVQPDKISSQVYYPPPPKVLGKNIGAFIFSILLITGVFFGGMIINEEIIIADGGFTFAVRNSDDIEPEIIKEIIDPWDIRFVSVSTSDHTLAIDSDGNLWAWGDNHHGRLGDGTRNNSNVPVHIMEGTTFLSVSAGHNHTMAIDTNRNLWAWGSNHYGQLGDGTTNISEVPVRILAGIAFRNVYAFQNYTMAIDVAGNLWTWGENSCGQLGDGTTENRSTPTHILSNVTFSSVSSSGRPEGTGNSSIHTIALDTNGNIWAWGINGSGQLGDGTTYDIFTPTLIETGALFSAVYTHHIASTQGFTRAIDTEGNIWAWGAYTADAQGADNAVSTPRQITMGNIFYTSLSVWDGLVALDENGTLWRADSIDPYTGEHILEVLAEETTFVSLHGRFFICTEGNLRRLNRAFGDSAQRFSVVRVSRGGMH